MTKRKILDFMFTQGNVDDREALKQEKFLKNIKGIFVRTYIG